MWWEQPRTMPDTLSLMLILIQSFIIMFWEIFGTNAWFHQGTTWDKPTKMLIHVNQSHFPFLKHYSGKISNHRLNRRQELRRGERKSRNMLKNTKKRYWQIKQKSPVTVETRSTRMCYNYWLSMYNLTLFPMKMTMRF